MLYSGLTSVTFRDLSVNEIIQLCAENDIQGIEWGGDIHVPPGDIERAESIRKKTEDHGLTVCSYGSYYRCKDTPHTFNDILLTAKALKAPLIRAWAGEQGSDKATPDYRKSVAQNLRRAVSMAQDHDITIGLEYHGGTLTDTQNSAHQLIEEVGMPELKLYWQPRTEDNSLDPNVVELEAIIPHLAQVHCFHWEDNGAIRLPLQEGLSNWSTYIQYLKSMNADHYVILEFVKDDSVSQFQADAKVLNSLLK